jgi:membrane protease subunit HflK
MARDLENLPPDDKVRGQIGRTIGNTLAVLVSVGILAAWAYFGFYQLDPGESAVILRLGSYDRTVANPGLKWHLPPPLEAHDIIRVDLLEREEFGFIQEGEVSERRRLEGVIQTQDNNIAHIGFVVQYQIKDAFFSRYRVAQPRSTLRDTAQAAIREVIGRTSIDGVLADERGAVQRQTLEQLQDLLDRYESGLEVKSVVLQEVQPPPEVQDAFDDVVAAAQDRDRKINEAKGYANEVLPEARGRAAELRRGGEAYRDSKIAQSTGDASRFTALLEEYRKAPEVTRRRLYLETMEEVLPRVEKVIIEPGTTPVLPYLPLGRSAAPAGGAR